MKRTLLAVALTGAFFASTAVQADELKTDQEKLGYSMGLMFGHQLKSNVGDLDLDSFTKGLKDVYKDKKPALSEEEVAAVMQKFQQAKIAEQKAEFEKQAKENKEAGEAFMKKNGAKKGVVTTDSGLQIEVLKKGKGASPKADDTVKVHYRGELVDGTEFDSSYSRNEPVTFPLNGVIPGWTEGLQQMKKGEKARLVIPSDLAYGPRGMGGAIGPNETLVFEVELLDINPKAEDAKQNDAQ